MNENFSWPRLGDKLFIAGDDWWNACVGHAGEKDPIYAEGYRLGARTLVEQVGETQRNQDFLIYPIVFLYRQAIEVSLKQLRRKAAALLEREIVKRKGHGHGLVDLWEQARPMIEEIWPEGPSEDLDAAEDVLRQFEEKDPGSTTFRFPDASPERGHIHILTFAEVAERAFALIDACNTAIGEYLQQEWEMAREFSE